MNFKHLTTLAVLVLAFPAAQAQCAPKQVYAGPPMEFDNGVAALRDASSNGWTPRTEAHGQWVFRYDRRLGEYVPVWDALCDSHEETPKPVQSASPKVGALTSTATAKLGELTPDEYSLLLQSGKIEPPPMDSYGHWTFVREGKGSFQGKWTWENGN